MLWENDSDFSWDIKQSFRRREFRVQIPGMLQEEALDVHVGFAGYSYFQDLPYSPSTLPGVPLTPHRTLLKCRSPFSVIWLLMTARRAKMLHPSKPGVAIMNGCIGQFAEFSTFCKSFAKHMQRKKESLFFGSHRSQSFLWTKFKMVPIEFFYFFELENTIEYQIYHSPLISFLGLTAHTFTPFVRKM